ncbi:MAG: sigma-70 family RNA polymerase sigma factor [Planctomycetota bacterium]
MTSVSQNTRLSLIEELKGDDAEPAWRNFCEIYQGLIQHWLRREGLQQADIDDVQQEVMTTVVAEVPKFVHNGRRGAFRCWLRQIVSNRLHRTWEKKSREQRKLCGVDFSLIAEQLADNASQMSAAWDQEHHRFVLNRLLTLLSPRFTQTHIEGFRRVAMNVESAEQVANELGMSLGALRVAQHRILKALRQIAGELVQ